MGKCYLLPLKQQITALTFVHVITLFHRYANILETMLTKKRKFQNPPN